MIPYKLPENYNQGALLDELGSSILQDEKPMASGEAGLDSYVVVIEPVSDIEAVQQMLLDTCMIGYPDFDHTY